MTRFDEIVDRVAQSRLSVLITGETGAGKEILARRLHERSSRARKPFVALNCAAFCDSLLESELFGYDRGSFTGAGQSKMGLIEAADGGTLFLDEVGDLSPSAQAKLLRVIETRQVLRIGAVSPRSLDVRFLAATNRDLEEAVMTGGFRADLRFRLEGIRLHVPPLRARVGEILPTAHQFLLELANREDLPLAVLTEPAEAALVRHSWAGNFRELRNVVERAAIICGNGYISPEDLQLTERPWAALAAVADAPVQETVDLERDRILSALASCAGNQTRAANILGISRRTLITRLDGFGIARPRARSLRSVPASQSTPVATSTARRPFFVTASAPLSK